MTKIEQKTRVLIADDHQIVIDGIKLMLRHNAEIVCVGEVLSGEEALRFLQVNTVDLVLLDINMPGMGGVQTCKKIKQVYPDTRVLVLSMFNEMSMITSMVKAGANGYILKSEGQEEVLEAIEQVMTAGHYFSEEVQKLKSASSGIRKRSPSRFIPNLSRREKQILELIMEEMTTKEIAEQLAITFNTVESYRKNLLGKLGARNTAGLVRTALENGLV